MGHGPYEEPLKPVFYKESPPWFPRIWPWPFNFRKYEGRDEWWAEAGYKDPYLARGLLPTRTPEYLEQDEGHWDPKVADGTSIGGPMGQDSRYHRDFTTKADQPGDFFDFQKKLMKNSSQYRQIAENWELSKEHPGMKVNPKLAAIDHYSKWTLGKPDFFPRIYHYGPRFWDKPINEGCFEKGFCLAKYATVAAILTSFFKIKAYGKITAGEWSIRKFIYHAIPDLPRPIFLAFVYGFSLCTAAKIRHIDDMWNFVIAAGAFCFTHASITNKFSLNYQLFPIFAVAGAFFHYCRCMPEGMSGFLIHPDMGGFHGSGPYAWKMYQHGKDKKLNPEDYVF